MEGERARNHFLVFALKGSPPLLLDRELDVANRDTPISFTHPTYIQGLVISIQYAKVIGMAC